MFIILLPKWHDLPLFLKHSDIKVYYNLLAEKQNQLRFKRFIDISLSIFLLILLSPVFLFVIILIKLDSPGKIFFKQERVTQLGEKFYIFKFRTMYEYDSKIKCEITFKNDKRVTRIGKFLRKFRIDEFPQLLNILKGQMTFVGTRPEVFVFINEYSPEMYATLLLPAGLVSMASIEFKDEVDIIKESNYMQVYTDEILPKKMEYNLDYIKKFNVFQDFKIMFMTLIKIFN
ncbi:MAG: sugar transferase [Candidatus Improbicoccus devescovinae]|nr:MAG: sugar transferase [Candidatus Improbicoccus devescovinae]